jgi:hypothetical protein
MSENPFAGLNDTAEERKQRDDARRSRRWKTFRKRLLLILSAIAGATAGAACAALTSEGGSRNLPGYVLGAILGGMAGAAVGLGYAVWRLMQQSMDNELFGEPEEADPGRMFFWLAASCAISAAIFGAAEAADMVGADIDQLLLAIVWTAGGSVIGLLPALVPWLSRDRHRSGEGQEQ